MKTLQMTIGPVQSFVSQARRTRDLLAGSFLLSFLSGHAMAQVIEKKGHILYPQVDEKGNREDPLLKKIMEGRKPDSSWEGPLVGSLPNRFQAKIPSNLKPETICNAVNKAWLQVARAVRKKVFPDGFPSEATKKIWNRQVKNFWEITWVIGDDHLLLRHRKYWRSHIPQREEGDKCTLTGNLQELSGYIRAHQREKQDQFWQNIRERSDISPFNLQENERLSAIALIKRFYPTVAEEALGWKLPRQALNFPSTAYLAAMPWIFSMEESRTEAIRAFVQLVRQADVMPVKDPSFQPTGMDDDIYRLEGSVFFASNLKRENYWKEERKNPEYKKVLLEELKKLTDKGKNAPSPFYALLLMDGDQLGDLLAKHEEKEKVSEALARFTNAIPQVVQEQRGFLIYAGGDDVLALFPLKSALAAAVKLRQTYREAFVKVGITDQASISAALIYAHYKAPLQGVLQNGHQLLDGVAKGISGRDSLAVRVWKGGGPVWTWSAPWQRALKEADITRLEAVREQIRNEKAYSPSFFHHVKTRLEPLQPQTDDDEKYQEMIQRLLVAEYKRSDGEATREQAEERMKALLWLCLESRRDKHKYIKTGGFRTEGALIAHFLATEGREAH